MTSPHIQAPVQHPVRCLIVDMSDCYTWSFPEFMPFCRELYYFSNFKDYNAAACTA